MTFTMNNSLTIEVLDLIKSRGGRMTVWKELQVIEVLPKQDERSPRFAERWFGRKEPDSMPIEPELQLKSKLFPVEYFSGWNYAECNYDKDPIPVIIPTGHEMGPNMLHVWMTKPQFAHVAASDWWIPFTGHYEDVVGAGWATSVSRSLVQIGFKKLYLKSSDKELGAKMLLEQQRRERKVHGLGNLHGLGNPNDLAQDMLRTQMARDIQDMLRNKQYNQLLQQSYQRAQISGGSMGGGRGYTSTQSFAAEMQRAQEAARYLTQGTEDEPPNQWIIPKWERD